MLQKKSLQESKKSLSTIYIEHRAKKHPKTLFILQKLKNRRIIYIDHYKDIFNRSNQNFDRQKSSLKLILAIKDDNFLYKGSKFSNSFGYENFYYTSQIYNCIYDCKYCYLQGMYSSAYATMFVNIEDTFKKVLEVSNGRSMFLPISYDTDILAFEHICGFVRDWIEFAKHNLNINIEIRTKNSAYNIVKNYEVSDNVIFAFSLSPKEVVKNIELKTPSLKSRVEGIKRLLENNFNVRLCFDPIIRVDNYEDVYKGFLEYIFNSIDDKDIKDYSFGSFRMSSQYLKNIKKKRKNIISYHPYENINGEARYSDEEQILQFFYSNLVKFTHKSKIFY